MSRRFDPQPLRGLVARHVRNKGKAARILVAMLPVLSGLVERDFILARDHVVRPWNDEECEALRLAIEGLFRVSVTSASPVSLGRWIFHPLGEEHADRRAARITDILETASAHIVSPSELLERSGHLPADPWKSWMRTRIAELSLGMPLPDRADPPFADFWDETLSFFAELYGLAMQAAALEDERTFECVMAFLPWLSQCIPLGVSAARPHEFQVFTA